MNTLSWLILLAGVTGSVKTFIVMVTILFALMALISVFVFFTMIESNAEGDDLKKCGRYFTLFLTLMIFTGSLAALTPSRQTVLLIAASQMGEQVLNHPRVNQVMDPGIELLTTWMQKETADLRNQMQPSGNNSRR